MKMLPVSGLLTVISFLLFSCYPDKINNPSDLDAIITDYDPSYQFKNQKTYFLPGQVLPLVVDTVNPSNNQAIDPTLGNYILEQISSNLNSRGYSRVDTIDQSTQPDFIAVAYYADQNVSGTTFIPAYGGYGGYGGYYGGYYGWGPGWGYSTPYYYPVSYSYNTGTLLLEIVDPNGADSTTKQVPVVWRAIFNGVLTDLNDFEQRLQQNISQAFIQSPYIAR